MNQTLIKLQFTQSHRLHKTYTNALINKIKLMYNNLCNKKMRWILLGKYRGEHGRFITLLKFIINVSTHWKYIFSAILFRLGKRTVLTLLCRYTITVTYRVLMYKCDHYSWYIFIYLFNILVFYTLGEKEIINYIYITF
jgi:hypothetical protein